MWQLDFTEFETRHGGVWRVAGVSDYWSKLELGWHLSTTANHRDAIETIELAIAETERVTGSPLRELLVDEATGETRPIALVTDNGRCFKAARFAAFIARRPELIHIRTRRKSPQQNGVRERAFGSLKYEHLYRQEINDGHQLGREVESYRRSADARSCSRSTMPGARSTAVTSAPPAAARRASSPVPVATSSSRSPGRRASRSSRASTAERCCSQTSA